jgi:hypothetical protein
MFSKATIVALFAAVASAQHAPVGNPSGNPITRPLNEVVPACKPFTITWQPTTPNSVSLVLLRGPSTNVVPLQNIVVGIANSGSYVWTPPATLEADTSRYGLQLIDDVTGQYQYSTQFGISKGAECNGFVASSSSSSQYNGGGYPVSTPAPSSSGGYPVSSPVVHPSSKANTTVVTASSVAPSGYPVSNSTIVLPSKSLSVPSSLVASATSGSSSATRSAPAQSTGGASTLSAGFSLVGAIAAMAYML